MPSSTINTTDTANATGIRDNLLSQGLIPSAFTADQADPYVTPDGNRGPRRVLVAQMGARMHYGVPRILHEQGRLACLFTDFYAGKWPYRIFAGRSVGCLLPHHLRILLSRRCDLPSGKVRAFQRFGGQVIWRSARLRRPGDLWRVNLWAAQQFNRLCVNEPWPDVDCVYGFRVVSQEIFEHAVARGIRCVLEQPGAPALIEHDILAGEYERWSGWEQAPDTAGVRAYAEREAAEYELADLILAPSRFVLEGLVKLGVSRHRCCVVPYGVHVPAITSFTPKKRTGPLKVLFVGQVRLLKGIPYLLDAMRQFKNDEVQCRIVGSIKVTRKRLDDYVPPNVTICGSMPRNEVGKHYEWADVFCLPSLCEGSATVIYEALAHGLDVITTPNSGSLIENDYSGRNIIVPIRDADAIAVAIRRFADKSGILSNKWATPSDVSGTPSDELVAAELARQASYESYSRRLNDIFTHAFPADRSGSACAGSVSDSL